MSASRSTSTGRFELHVLSDLTHLAISQKGNEQCLLVNRNAANTTSGVVLEDVSELNHAHGRSLKFDAIFGIYTLLRGKYLALVTESRSVGKFKVRGADVDIRQVTGIEMVLLPTQQLPHLTPTQMEDEERYMAMITNDVEAQLLYFAFDYDLTHTLQRMTTSLSPTVSIAERADPRFCWNYPACSFLLEKKLFAWVVPIMQGYVEVCKNVSIGANKTFDILYISRRSCRRQGTRFTMRGIDSEGNVANFVETEQALLFPDGRETSFVQIRGSIPVVWSSPVTLKYAPKVYQRQELEKDTAAFQLHAEELMKLYGRVILVNLIDKKTEQLKLGEAFEKTFANASALNTHILANIRYVWFDFHRECRRMQYSKLGNLISQVDDDFQDYGYFSKSATGQVTSTQSGVVRTNCMDNLDRTNVVQSLFARRSLLLQVGESVQGNVLTSPFDSFEKTFKNVWGNNADAISFLYAGTGALKTDFTRTGKRTTRGALQDGYNSVLRYILNNFYDGHRQDAMDLLLLRYVPSRHKGSPFVAASSLQTYLIGLVGTTLVLFTGLIVWDGLELTHLFNRLLHATGTVVAALAFTFGYFVRRGTKLAIANRPAFRPEDGCTTSWK
ncbi:hypothetical protein H310_03184 [Aphanomyces invadans]|uniref:SAC domain-containing protein n=1 Tax=Aphanomyces invadans TaxID=157072 RepID=A0A024UIL5_9STRA|nr:hypothetical protein H310_03184 [Aphanomyces invadans]ETW05418.1 hypothetical protein H310_03184 [Aphanomyces invadans]|eukprot:XP_008865195.1 hypothetical protein H310_03184 [Aphanomyces invadans]